MARNDESALRGLIGAGPSLLGVSGAMRVRDALRVLPEDLEAAEQRVVIKKAAPKPEDPLPPRTLPPRTLPPRERRQPRARS